MTYALGQNFLKIMNLYLPCFSRKISWSYNAKDTLYTLSYKAKYQKQMQIMRSYIFKYFNPRYLNILRAQRAFQVKQKQIFHHFKEPSLK